VKNRLPFGGSSRSQIEKRSADMDSWSPLIEAEDLSASARLGHEFGCYLNAHNG